MTTDATVIDCDQHLYETRDLWRDHIDPVHRHLALAIEDDELGYPWVTWRGRRLQLADVQLFPALEQLFTQALHFDWNYGSILNDGFVAFATTNADSLVALHDGKGKAGQFLYPAFPYPNYTRITRVDADAMYAYLKTLPAVHQPNRRHDLRFPYNQRPLLALWRALYFRPGVYQPDSSPGRGPDWNRGAYLVQGLGHCSACHADRNVLGATQNSLDLAGGLIPILNWYAPPLSAGTSGPGDWAEQDLADLLKTGISARGTASGPMAEVVGASLQHLSGADIGAIAGYLKSLPPAGARSVPTRAATAAEQDPVLKLGATLYKNHCAECHMADGAGIPPAYPALAGNRALTGPSPVNPIRMVLNGGYPPSTGGNPRPYGMPPYGPTLEDAEVAALVSYIRQAWGNRAAPVDAAEVGRYRAVPVD